MYRRPDLFQKVISVNEKAVTEYLNAQIEAGAQAIQIFDTWGGCLADGLYQQYSLASIRNVIANLTREHEGGRVPGRGLHEGRLSVAEGYRLLRR